MRSVDRERSKARCGLNEILLEDVGVFVPWNRARKNRLRDCRGYRIVTIDLDCCHISLAVLGNDVDPFLLGLSQKLFERVRLFSYVFLQRLERESILVG